MEWFSLLNDEPPREGVIALREILVTMTLIIFGYTVLSTPIKSAFASFHPLDFLKALSELRHVRSTSDVKLWWNEWKHDNSERRQQMLLKSLLQSSSKESRTIRASNGSNLRGIPHVQSLFVALNKLHNSSSNGHLNQSSNQNGEDVSSEDEFRDTDHDRFERAWKSYIHKAEYKRLVLPPECKLVDSDWREHNVTDTSTRETTWQRLVAYLQNLFGLWMKLFSTEGFKKLLLWVMEVIRYKLRKRRGLPVEDDDEEDDDDGSIVTLGTPKGSVKKQMHVDAVGNEAPPSIDRGNTPRMHGSSKKSENDPSIMNIPSLQQSETREKTSLYPRKHLDSGDDDTFTSAVQLDSSDRASSLDIPLTVVSKRSNKLLSPIPTPLTKSQQSLKKKDILEHYRQQKSVPKAQSYERSISPMPSPKVKRITTESIDMNFFDTAHSNSELRDLSRAVPIPDSNGFILGDEFISSSCTPLLVFVNSRSGPQQGNFLIAQFKHRLNPIQVWDLASCKSQDDSPNTLLFIHQCLSFDCTHRVYIRSTGEDLNIIFCLLCSSSLSLWGRRNSQLDIRCVGKDEVDALACYRYSSSRYG